jgi:hypothetical protein
MQKEAVWVATLRALRDAAVYMKADKAGTVQVIQKIMKISDRQVAETAYEILKESVVTDPRIPVDVMQQSIKLAMRSDPRVKNVDLSKAVEMRLASKAMDGAK